MRSIYTLSARTLSGHNVSLKAYSGNVLLVVNIASNCSFSSQLGQLQWLYERFRSQGFVVLGFPSDQFHQELDAHEAIMVFCKRNFGVTFPLFEKVWVNGKHAHPLFRYLTYQQPALAGNRDIKWNFTKFLINRKGIPFARYPWFIQPQKMTSAIEALLKVPVPVSDLVRG
ncbi:MAG: glutathione peroxidase [Bacteroidales bacterium]